MIHLDRIADSLGAFALVPMLADDKLRPFVLPAIGFIALMWVVRYLEDKFHKHAETVDLSEDSHQHIEQHMKKALMEWDATTHRTYHGPGEYVPADWFPTKEQTK